jgi:hypothetical protein
VEGEGEKREIWWQEELAHILTMEGCLHSEEFSSYIFARKKGRKKILSVQ